MAKKNMMSDDDHIPEIMTEQPNPWKSGKGWNGVVDMDGSQTNGRHGSPLTAPLKSPDYESFGAVKYDMQDDINDSKWEKKMGVSKNDEGEFSDINNGYEAKEVNFSGDLDGKSIGMPPVDESLSPDCGRY